MEAIFFNINDLSHLLAIAGLSSMFIAGLTLLTLALGFIIILSIANARLRVDGDPKVEAVESALPAVNCGACGFAGCRAYAEAVVEDPSLIGRCTPGGENVAQMIAQILGTTAGPAQNPKYAVVHCSAHTDDKINNTKYLGVATCREANQVAGAIGCPYGCLAYGDCVKACNFDAIHIVDGLATVDYEKCTACGACVEACPRQLIDIIEFKEDPMLVIACASVDKAKEVRGYCKVGCVGCGVCAKLSPNAFQMQQNLAMIDYENYGRWADAETRKGIDKCPRKAMKFVGRNADQPAAQAAVAGGKGAVAGG